MEFNDATRAQIRAAEPGSSTWVSANAGSGKTRVLTDRVARLLLHGTMPQKILCLTYTKAAAAEMQNRLFQRLGEWAMMADADLRNALSELGEADKQSDADLRSARRLFANALETPGGLKIQTIHSFCDRLLRRFPLEAGVSPQFEVLEDRQAKILRAEILEDLADGTGLGAVDQLARYLTGLEPDAILAEIASKRAKLDLEATRTALGVSGADSESDMFDELLGLDGRQVLAQVRGVIRAEQDKTAAADGIDRMLNARSLAAFLAEATGKLIFGATAKAGPFSAKLNSLPTQKPVRENHPKLVDAANALMERTADVRARYVGLLALQKAEALAAFATEFLHRYDARKTASGRLDYDDLIARAERLLSTTNSAQWVLYKLDGGIDHILVDEAQDTSPAQWAVVKLLSDEFTSGEGGNEAHRTIFVVGDEKQSIYSFQGADPAEFEVMRQRFYDRLQQVGQRLEDQDLLFSFRSAEPVLRLVDRVFDGPAGSGFRKAALHRPYHDSLPGRVDLWPFEEKIDAKDETPWFKPVDTPAPDNPQSILARKIAGWIEHLLQTGYVLPGKNRSVRASDFLILVQGRRPIFHNIIKELKARELPVAGADRLNVGEELAVRDILALLKFADLQEDDLSLAEALKSPLLGFSEDDLFRVAHGRERSLWEAMRGFSDVYPTQLSILRDVIQQADFLRPFELIDRVLTLHKGRENLLARLGSEAEDGIDELLSQAMRYEQLEAPSLSGFLNWFAAGKVEIKREMDSGAGQIRVMTVHGAKGLEAPIVILPDTEVRAGGGDRSQIIGLKDGGFLWKSPDEIAPDLQIQAKAMAKEFADKERMRLLYVALTRAEQWLVVAGAGDAGKPGKSWYNLVSEAMVQDDWLPVETKEIQGVGPCNSVLYHWSDTRVELESLTLTSEISLPDWVGSIVPKYSKPAKPMSPSKFAGAKVVGVAGDEVSVDSALRKGRQVHLLLEHLANTVVSLRREKAERLLVGDCSVEDSDDFDAVLEETNAVLDDENLSFVFAPDALAEVGVSAELDALGGARIDGIIDRLIIQENRVIAIDFKTNAVVPRTANEVPLGILRQLGAYYAALEQIYPNKKIEVAVLWTRTREIMTVPHDIVMNALQSTTTS